MKLTLIIDKSESYIGFEKVNVLKKWGIDEAEVENVDSLSRVGEETIFGDSFTSVLSVNILDSWKKLVLEFQKLVDAGEIEYKVRQGLIITSTLARNSTKKMEELVKKAGGEVIVAKESAKDKTNVSAKMLSKLKLANPVKDFLVEYAADDYDSLVSVIQSISDLPPAAQAKISIEDMYIRLPKPPGAVPPWELEKPLLAGNVEQTIEMYRRITSHSHFLVVLSLVKNKMLLSWRIASLQQSTPRLSEAAAAEQLGQAKNYPFKLAYDNASRTGYDKLLKIIEILLKAEADVKGGSSADSSVVMEIALIRIAQIFKK